MPSALQILGSYPRWSLPALSLAPYRRASPGNLTLPYRRASPGNLTLPYRRASPGNLTLPYRRASPGNLTLPYRRASPGNLTLPYRRASPGNLTLPCTLLSSQAPCVCSCSQSCVWADGGPCRQAGVASAMQRALLMVMALWLPLLPFLFIMRHVIKERSGMHAPADAPASACPVAHAAACCAGAPPQR